MATLRPSRRSSRPASPAGRTSSAVASPRITVQSTIDEVPPAGQTSLDTWLEPPLRSATAYEDAGLDKSAIFEHMQPLGTLPNPAKLKFKPFIRSTNEKRQALKPWGDNTTSTPELTPPVEVQPAEDGSGVDLPSSRTDSIEKEAFPLLNGSHTEDPGIETPPLAHDAPSPASLSPQSPKQNEMPVVTAVGTPTSIVQELPPQQISTPQPLPATYNGIVNDPFTSTTTEFSDKDLADAVYGANQRAQEAGDEVQGEALIALWQQAKKPGNEELLSAIKATLRQTSTTEQAQLFGLKFKHQRAVTKRRLRTKSVNTRPSSINSIPYTDYPEPRQPSLPLTTSAPMISTTSTAPTTPIIGSNAFNAPIPPMNPPMGSFHTTPSRAAPKATMNRSPHKESPAKSATPIPPPSVLQPSPRIRSRNTSNAVAPESPVQLGKRRRPNKETEVAASDGAEESTPQAKRRATINANREAESTQSDGPKINGAAARMTRSRKSLFEPLESSPKPIPQTPPTRTRSGRRRQSSSDLSSVDEEIVNDGPRAPVPTAPKRTAAEAALDEVTEQTRRRRARYDAQLTEHQTEWLDLPQNSGLRLTAHTPKEQTLKINVAPSRSTRSGVRRQSGRDESAPLTPAAPSPREGLFPGAARATRSSQQFSNAEALLANKPKAGARFKTSPIKDRGTAAGVSRNNGYGGSPPSRQASPSRGGNDEMSRIKDDDEHSDQCHACGEEGKLICCDTCRNALHYRCCDPPIKGPAEFKNRAFYCQECKKQDQQDVDEASNSNSILGPIFARLLTTNTSSFQLPKEIQKTFGGVTSKDNGEYADDMKKTVTTNRRNTAGWDETGNSREKDQPRLMRCQACQKSSLDGRSIIQCDECNTQWHLDCLDPPQANPPTVNHINRTRAFFRCPRHAENDMRMFGNARLAFAEPDGKGERGHKLRKLRKAKIIRPIIQRGNKNNGYIEVDVEEEPIVQEDGVIYKLSDTAIKLDFLEKAYAEREINQRKAAKLASPEVDIEAEIQRRVEEQLAQRIAQFQQQNQLAQIAFVASSRPDQELVASLVGLSRQERIELDTNNLAILTQAAQQSSAHIIPTPEMTVSAPTLVTTEGSPASVAMDISSEEEDRLPPNLELPELHVNSDLGSLPADGLGNLVGDIEELEYRFKRLIEARGGTFNRDSSDIVRLNQPVKDLTDERDCIIQCFAVLKRAYRRNLHEDGREPDKIEANKAAEKSASVQPKEEDQQ